jgi:uncharacterized peroxidase-related enzyme
VALIGINKDSCINTPLFFDSRRKTMTEFKIHNPKSAPVEAQKLLDNSLHKYGFVPNLHGGLAESPAALQAYLELTRLFDSTSLTPAERQVVLIAASVENHCSYCVAAHSMIARQMVKIDSAVVDALRQGQPLPDSKLEVLAVFTRAVVKQRGMVTGKPLADFISAGYNRAQVLDVFLGVAMKTLSNYTNHIIDTPLDKQFQSEAWDNPACCSNSKACA